MPLKDRSDKLRPIDLYARLKLISIFRRERRDCLRWPLTLVLGEARDQARPVPKLYSLAIGSLKGLANSLLFVGALHNDGGVEI